MGWHAIKINQSTNILVSEAETKTKTFAMFEVLKAVKRILSMDEYSFDDCWLVFIFVIIENCEAKQGKIISNPEELIRNDIMHQIFLIIFSPPSKQV